MNERPKYETCIKIYFLKLKNSCNSTLNVILEYVLKIFGPIIKNNHNYTFWNDPKHIEKVELFYIILHKKPYLPTL